MTKEEYENMSGDDLAAMIHRDMEDEIASMREKEEKLIQEMNRYSDKKMKKIFSYQK